jgi:hypothetical protein
MIASNKREEIQNQINEHEEEINGMLSRAEALDHEAHQCTPIPVCHSTSADLGFGDDDKVETEALEFDERRKAGASIMEKAHNQLKDFK